jgi:polyphosphate kinase
MAARFGKYRGTVSAAILASAFAVGIEFCRAPARSMCRLIQIGAPAAKILRSGVAAHDFDGEFAAAAKKRSRRMAVISPHQHSRLPAVPPLSTSECQQMDAKPAKPAAPHPLDERLHDEMVDAIDEELELEIDDSRLASLLEHTGYKPAHATLDRHTYFKELLRLQKELIKLQDWVVHQKLKLMILFEGRDAAGKGGVIKRITQRLNPRICKAVALSAPSERERTQWYFQRYVTHLPAAGEIVLFDRSWYNRAGVERVMGFCSEADCEEFFRTVPEFERMLVRSGIVLIKYWFSITDEEQNLRFLMRIHDPLKQWKLSPMDLESRRRWEMYTKAKEEMLERTHIPEARWWVVEAVDKKRARLNCIHHLLQQIPYKGVPHDPIVMPQRDHKPDYTRHPVPPELYVPAIY